MAHMFSNFEVIFQTLMRWMKVKRWQRGSKPFTEKELQEQTVRRITLILSLLKPVCGKPQSRVFKVNGQADVHRFMILLCDVENLHYKNVGGLMRCNIILPNNAGSLVLREKKIDNVNHTIAVLKMDIPLLSPAIDEVIFKMKKV